MSRPPRSFDWDEPASEPVADDTRTGDAQTGGARRPRTIDVPADFAPIDDEAAQRRDAAEIAALEPPPPPPSARRFSFARLLLFALGSLASLAIGLAIDEFIRELFERADWLGWLAVALAALLGLATIGIVVRELLGLRRLAKVEQTRAEAIDVLATGDHGKAATVLANLRTLYAGRADAAAGRARLEATSGEIIDAPDRLRLAERELLVPLDATARKMARDAAARVSVVTAVSPRAFIDVAFVLSENVRLIRRIADLYGGRPGTIGFWGLTRDVIGHLAVTGSIAVGDSMIQQVVGHGLAARLSSRLGEGVVNGLLTARVGVAAIDVCRPLPFIGAKRPGVGDFVADLTRRGHNSAAPAVNASRDGAGATPR